MHTELNCYLNRYFPVLLMVLFGAFILLVAAAEEPYHIDELRQVSYYDQARLIDVAKASIHQEQPPLDSMLNSLAQDVLGVGDVRQRLLSVGFGVGTLLLTAILALRSGFSTLGTVFTLGVMVLTPLSIGIMAYARPYALPLFLMMTYLTAAHLWLERGRPWTLVTVCLAAVLLPWSRTADPVIFLVCSAVAIRLLAACGESRKKVQWLLGAACLGLVSSIPSIYLMMGQVGDRTAAVNTLIARLARFGSEVPEVIGSSFPYWPVVAVFVVFAALMPAARRVLRRLWWWWILLATALGCVLAFVAVANGGLAFRGRYLFTWVIPIAVLVGGVVSSMGSRPKYASVPVGVTTGAGMLLLAWAGHLAWHDLTTRSRPDWQAISAVITDDLPPDTAIVYDHLRPLGVYRFAFYGDPRYTKGHSRIPLSLRVIRYPSLLTPGVNTAVVLLSESAPLRVAGWVGIEIDDYFTVYLPSSPKPGLAGAAQAAEAFGKAAGPDSGAALQLMAASLWLEAGHRSRASSLAESLMANENIRASVAPLIARSKLAGLIKWSKYGYSPLIPRR